MRGGVPLLVLVLSCWLLFNLGRWGFFAEETPAAFLPSPPATGVPVWLGDGYRAQGLHQFSDGDTPMDAISLTQGDIRRAAVPDGGWLRPLQPGERLDYRRTPDGRLALYRSLLPAQQRLLLHLPLHPDRMSRADWESLPGVGPKLATAILLDRQKNGDFGTWERLDRVKGIGPGRLKQWREFFLPQGQEVNK